MLRDSNGKKRETVFGFDSYPGPSTASWNNPQPQLEQNAFRYMPLAPHAPQPPGAYQGFSSYIPSPPFISTLSQVPNPFVFGGVNGSGGGSSPTLNGQFQYHTQRYHEDSETQKTTWRKRKLDLPSSRPCKQLITEEKMAEHMSNLHINSESATSPLEPESVKNKRLYMCEEMRKLQSEPLLPAALMERIQRPCTALVLWQPPTKVLSNLDAGDDGNHNEKNNNNNDNNNDDWFAMARPLEQDMESEYTTGNMDLDA